jgi:hypothetical protein
MIMKVKTFFLLISLAAIFTACKSDIDVVGKWQIEKEEFFVKGELINKVENTGASLEFFADGTGADQEGVFNWRLLGDSLIITDYGQDFVYIITKYGQNRLVFEDRSYKKDTKEGDAIVITLSR